MHPYALDPIIMPFLDEFLKGNILTIGLVLSILKYIAIRTKSVKDDKILSLITGLGGVIFGKKINGNGNNKPTTLVVPSAEVPPVEEKVQEEPKSPTS